MLDVGWGDLIDYLGDDPHTQSIVIYMESIGDARAFLSAAREVALTKPIIVIKAGRTEAAAKAAASHTGALTGSDDGARRRLPPLRRAAGQHASPTCSIMAEVLAKQPRPKRPAPDDPDQRGRPRRARDRRADRRRRRSSPRWRPRRSRRSTGFCRRTGATPTRSTSWATPTRSATRRRWRSPRKTRTATACW